MLRRSSEKRSLGQTLIEYTMVIGVIVMILMAMSVVIKRGLQGMIKVAADQVGNQEGADQKFDESGHLVQAYSSTRMSGDKRTIELLGTTNYVYEDQSVTNSMVVSNLGFAEQD